MAWDLMEPWETWHNIDFNGIVKTPSAKEMFSYNKRKSKLLAGHKKKRAAIEAEAMKLGV